MLPHGYIRDILRYLVYLEGKREEITEDILSNSKTKRRNLYLTNGFGFCNNVAAKYKLKQLSEDNDNLASFYVSQVFNELIEQQKIVTAKTKSGTGFRTATIKDIAKVS